MTDRTDILARILNLRALAEGNGTEAEAFSAMRIAEKLMNSYRVEEAELALAEGLGEIKVDVVSERSDLGALSQGRNRHKVSMCLWDLARYCEVKVTVRPHEGSYHVIGDKPDVELFHYLIDMLKGALDRAYDQWKRQQQAVGRGAKPTFQISMAGRINARLGKMCWERTQDRADAEAAEAKLLGKTEEEVRIAVNNGDIKALSSNMSLVVASAAEVKHKAVEEVYQAAYKNVRLGTASGFGYRGGGSNAASAGRNAGDRVNFGRPVGGSASKRLA